MTIKRALEMADRVRHPLEIKHFMSALSPRTVPGMTEPERALWTLAEAYRKQKKLVIKLRKKKSR